MSTKVAVYKSGKVFLNICTSVLLYFCHFLYSLRPLLRRFFDFVGHNFRYPYSLIFTILVLTVVDFTLH